jgi:hypothetical protein
MRCRTFTAAALAALLANAQAHAQDFRELRTGAAGVVVRVRHPVQWQQVVPQDAGALAEVRGPQGPLTAVLQVGLGQPRADIASVCKPERALTMLQNLQGDEADARVTDVVARTHEGRAAYDVRYERHDAQEFLRVHSLVVCTSERRVLVSCGATGRTRPAVAAIDPVCRQVMDSVSISEE